MGTHGQPEANIGLAGHLGQTVRVQVLCIESVDHHQRRTEVHHLGESRHERTQIIGPKGASETGMNHATALDRDLGLGDDAGTSCLSDLGENLVVEAPNSCLIIGQRDVEDWAALQE